MPEIHDGTWKQHGSPQNFRYYGRMEVPRTIGIDVVQVFEREGVLVLLDSRGYYAATFRPGARFWAKIQPATEANYE